MDSDRHSRAQRPRRLEAVVTAALEAFRVVVVTGPRQAGKTTLVRRCLAGSGTLSRLDDEATLQAARLDPVAFASFGPAPRAIDEVQRGGDALIRAIKLVVDDDPTPGQYLLNGSADFLAVPTLSESLTGRAAFLELWPFTQGELGGGGDGLLACALDDPARLLQGPPSRLGLADYIERLCAGGFPEAVALAPAARGTWFRNYVRGVTERDIVALTGARRADQLPRLLSLLAGRTAGELVVSHVHDAAGLGARATTDDYIAHLRMTYLVELVPAWSRSLTRKLTRHPKVHVVDSGLGAHLFGKGPDALLRPTDAARGPLLESFVVNELLRQAGWLHQEVRLHHLRDRDGTEVDIVAEAADGRVVAVEVKGSSTVGPEDARGLGWLRERIGDDLVAGIVLHTGGRAFSLGEGLMALPISYLWEVD